MKDLRDGKSIYSHDISESSSEIVTAYDRLHNSLVRALQENYLQNVSTFHGYFYLHINISADVVHCS